MGAQGQGLSCAKRPRTREMVGLTELDPILPEDGDADYNKWIKIGAGRPGPHHRDCHRDPIRGLPCIRKGAAWRLWRAIEDLYMVQGASLRYEAWMVLFAVRKTPTESYCDMYRRIENARNKIVRVNWKKLRGSKSYYFIGCHQVTFTPSP